MTIQEKYEEIRNLINWSDNTDSEKIKLEIMQKFSSNEIEVAASFATDLVDQLEAAIEKYESNGKLKLNIGSDDGMQDVLAEIVSKGVDEVGKYINNPRLIEEKYENDDYTENFFNCFPYKDDYEKMHLEYYQTASEEMKKSADWQSISQNESDMFNQILREFSIGEFRKEYTYDELYELGKKVDLGAWIANTWKSGCNFYSKNQKKTHA